MDKSKLEKSLKLISDDLEDIVEDLYDIRVIDIADELKNIVTKIKKLSLKE